MLIVGAFVTQAGNDSRQLEPMLAVLAKQKEQIGMPTQLLADSGYKTKRGRADYGLRKQTVASPCSASSSM